MKERDKRGVKERKSTRGRGNERLYRDNHIGYRGRCVDGEKENGKV